MEAASVSSITKRSMPIPCPAVGGMPYSRAWTYSASHDMGFIIALITLTHLHGKTVILVFRVIDFGKSVGDLPSGNE